MEVESKPDLKAAIDTAMLARGWILNSYAQFENLLSDLVRQARGLSEYKDLEVPYRTTTRISRVRELIARDGPLAKFKDAIGELIDRFESFEDARLTLVHSFTRVYHTPKGEVGFEFELHRTGEGGQPIVVRRMYRPEELDAEKTKFVSFADEALYRFLEVHDAMGWVGKASA